MKRDAASIIFRTVVFAGAMLGSSACAKKPAPAAPKNTAPMETKSTDPMMKGTTDSAKKPEPDNADPSADPCQGGERPRGTDDDGGGGVGRGFILS
jgi:hypothetical protein